MPFYESPDGARIFYDVHAGVDEGTPPLVLLHGLVGSRHLWARLRDDLRNYFRVINIEARGHGESRGAGPCELDTLAADVLGVLKQEGIGRAFFAGLSMGGMTALRMALSAPETVTTKESERALRRSANLLRSESAMISSAIGRASLLFL